MEKKDLLANYAASKQNMCITNDTISPIVSGVWGKQRTSRCQRKGCIDRSDPYFKDCVLQR